jgi:hypothetical protein
MTKEEKNSINKDKSILEKFIFFFERFENNQK